MLNTKLQQALQEWGNGEHHDGLLGLAWVFRKENVPMEEAESEIKAYYDTLDDASKRDGHHREVKEAVEKAYNAEIISNASPKRKPSKQETKKICMEKLKEWHNVLQGTPSLKAEILAMDRAEKRIRTKDALRAIFRNVSGGHIAQGKTYMEIRWMEADDDFATLNSASRYVSLATFGDKVDEALQTEADAQGTGRTHYLRRNENAMEIACMLLELDEPMGEELSKDAFEKMTENEKEEYRDKVLTDTCYILEEAGLRPTTITFSGNRSFHCLFRLAKPIDADEFNSLASQLKGAYSRIGADSATLDLARYTRMPCGTTQANAIANQGQRVMWLDADAEIDFVDYVGKIKALADKICPESALPQITLPIKEDLNAKGEKTYKFCPALWESFLKDIGVELVKLAGGETTLLITDERGVCSLVKPEDALDYFVKRIKQENYKAAAHFRYKEASKMKDVCQYAGMMRNANFPQDTQGRVLAAFRNGLLEIRQDKTTFHNGSYRGFDILESTPTLKRDWKPETGKGEFETFIERACGMEEGQQEWEARKQSIMSMLGYLVSTCKIPGANFLCMLTEETMTENEGGTGKSLIMMALNYWRQTAFKDMKFCRGTDNRFLFSGFKQGTQVMKFDDMPRDFDFEQLFSVLTGEMRIERKGKDEFYIPFELSPKIVAATNFFPQGAGNSFYRRIKIFEISNHYNALTTPKTEFGHLLFNDWDDEEWGRFDGFMVKCVQLYLQAGLIEYAGQNVEEKRLLANVKSDLVEFFDNFIPANLNKDISNTDFENAYSSWCRSNNSPNYGYKVKTLKSNLKLYCQTTRVYDMQETKNPVRVNGVLTRVFRLTSNENPKPDKNVFGESANSSQNGCYKTVTNAVTNVTNEVKNQSTGFEENAFFADAPDYISKIDDFPQKTSDFVTDVTNENKLKSVCNNICNSVSKVKIGHLAASVTNVTENSLYCQSKKIEEEKNIYKEVENLCNICNTPENAISGNCGNAGNPKEKSLGFASLKKSDGSVFETEIPEPTEKPWWIFNGVKMSFGEVKEEKRVICHVAYCDGRIPEPIEREDGTKYYQIMGSTCKALETGVLDETEPCYVPTAFVVL